MTILRPKNPQASNVSPLERHPTVNNSPEMEQRMNRIESNFGILNTLLEQVERKMADDSTIASLLSPDPPIPPDDPLSAALSAEPTELEGPWAPPAGKSTSKNRRGIRKPR
jgi:hypothetical protein